MALKDLRHGLSRRGLEAPEYRIWCHIKERCTNVNDKFYHRYGGRGIKMCDRWFDSVENFVADVGWRPGPRFMIERLDNNGDYCPENCKWATPKEQARNKSNNHLITFRGETLSLAAWEERTGIEQSTIRQRLNAGYLIEDALTAPRYTQGLSLNARNKAEEKINGHRATSTV